MEDVYKRQGLQLSLLMAVFLHIILIIIGSLLKRLLKLDPIEHATSIYSNSGNLIIPIVMSLFGKEWVIYASCFIVVQTLSLIHILTALQTVKAIDDHDVPVLPFDILPSTNHFFLID